MNEQLSKFDLSQGVGFIDGDYCPRGQMKISVHDLGFMMSDMTYDAVHVWKGKFFRLEDHLDRWERSIEARRYTTLKYDRDAVREIITECVRRSGLRDSLIYWIATRGVASDQRRDLRTCKNTFMAWAGPFNWIVPKEKMDRGEGANVFLSTVLRTPPESSDPTVKNFSRLDFSRALLEAYDAGSDYPILPDSTGHLTEGRGWNFCVVREGTVISPDSGVLDGVTRKTIMELCEKTNLEGRLGKLKPQDLLNADEAFLATTAGGITPITHVNGNPLKGGLAGPITTRLNQMYWALHDDPRYSTPIDYERTKEKETV
jgi:branched-chain amino acid aminotransferase